MVMGSYLTKELNYLEKVNQSKVAIHSSIVAEIKPCNSNFYENYDFFHFFCC